MIKRISNETRILHGENGISWIVPSAYTTQLTSAIPTALEKKYPLSNQPLNSRFVSGQAAAPIKNRVPHQRTTRKKSAIIENSYTSARLPTSLARARKKVLSSANVSGAIILGIVVKPLILRKSSPKRKRSNSMRIFFSIT